MRHYLLSMKIGTSFELRLLLGLASITTLLVFPTFTDPVNLPKFIALVSMSFALSLFSGVIQKKNFGFRLAYNRVKRISQEPIQLAIALFLIGMLVSTISSSSPFTGFFGLAGRRNGFITYVAMFLVFLIAKKISTANSLNSFMQALAWVGTFQASYMLIQFLNLDPISWTTVHENKMFGTFGNPNFSSAFLAIALPAMVYCTLTEIFSKKMKFFYALGTFAAAFALILSGVYQGLISVAASILVVISVYFYKNSNHSLKWISVLLLLGTSIFVSLGLFQKGPLASIFAKGTFDLRSNAYWPIAFDMGAQKPIFGVGTEQFINYFPKYFTPQFKGRFGQVTADNAHNYIFHFFAEGGVSVILPYLAFLILFTVLILTKFAKCHPKEKFLYLASLGVWTAYLGQMLVSIDTMGISVWIWLMTGILLATKNREVSSTANPLNLKDKTSKVAEQLVKKNHNATKGASFALGAVLFILLAPLAFLDNKVWRFEGALRASNSTAVTQVDLESLHRAAKIWFFDPTLLSRSSSILLSYGLQKEGFNLLNRSTLTNPDSPSTWNLRAAATESILNRQLAAPIRARELQLDPWNEESSIQYIKDLIAMNNMRMAKEEFKRLQEFSLSGIVPSELELFPLEAGR